LFNTDIGEWRFSSFGCCYDCGGRRLRYRWRLAV